MSGELLGLPLLGGVCDEVVTMGLETDGEIELFYFGVSLGLFKVGGNDVATDGAE